MRPISAIAWRSTFHHLLDFSPAGRSMIGYEEIEDGVAATTFWDPRANIMPSETSIDVLKISKMSRSHVRWDERLDHDKLLARFSEVAAPVLLLGGSVQGSSMLASSKRQFEDT